MLFLTFDVAVTDCSPPVDNITEMVKVLNETNSLTLFVREIRKEWRDMVL